MTAKGISPVHKRCFQDIGFYGILPLWSIDFFYSVVEVPMNWCTEFYSWQNYRGLLRTGTTLKIHEIVKILMLILRILAANNEYIFQRFTIRASRKRLRRLKEIAAYNVLQCLSSDSDI